MSQLINIISEKCPKCGEGKVFNTKGNIFLFRMPQMNKTCSCCGHHFEKETGYFFGSMYVSYALAVAEMVSAFLILQFFVEGFGPMIACIAVLAVLLSTFNFRLSRMLWIYLLDGPGRTI
ncbi:DUF983 domain-containing protein [Flavobacterium sp. RHBU_24]|uniref:DUF983 domain-containing protein n=1 Tax=Flavobacterium sp. RHBU_24 TaxID=3391185 RepID=UPI003984658E